MAWRFKDGTDLHLASFCLAGPGDAELRLTGADDPAFKFTALKAQYADVRDVLGGTPPGMPPGRGMCLS